MSSLVADSPGTPLRAAILHYFQWLAAHGEEAAAAAPTRAQSTAAADRENNASRKRGQKMVAALLEEFPELSKFTAPEVPQPELKVRFETFPLQQSRNTFLENRIAVLESSARNRSVSSRAGTGQKRKNPPAGTNRSPSKQQKKSVGVASVSKKKDDFSWHERYKQLVHFHKGYGHCRVTENNFKEAPGLGSWVARQRTAYRQEKLSPNQIEKLNKLDFEWIIKELPTIPWEDRYEQLKEFQREHGHCRVPRAHEQLGEWVHCQRSDYRNKKKCIMESDRVAKLQAVGFEFIVDRGHKSWDERFQQLVEFRRVNGHIDVPVPIKQKQPNGEKKTRAENDDETRFQTWIIQQKTFYRKYKSGDRSALTHYRFKKLDEIGFDKYKPLSRGDGRRDDDTWNKRLEQLRQYKDQVGDCNVPVNSEGQYKQLGEWVKKQRRFHRLLLAGEQSSMTFERKQALDNLGFEWVVRPGMLKENRGGKKGYEMEEDDDEDSD